jgi:hypothetical protein
MFLKGLKNVKIAWFDGDYEIMKGRVFNYPQDLSRLLLKSKLCSIPSMNDYVEEVKAWSLSVSPPLTGKRILQTVRDIFGIDLFVKVLQ